MRKPFIGGNWKMNTTSSTARELAKAIAESATRDRLTKRTDIALFPPFVYLPLVAPILKTTGILLGAQDVYFEPEGAFTGEISTTMLKDVGVEVVLTGHSERRHILNESDDLINKKTKAVLTAGLHCILCIGETLAQREADQTDYINTHQLRTALAGVTPDQATQLTIAYEPVWAIGTGKTATPEDAESAHHHIRTELAKLFTPQIADSTRIQYGGSVKSSNAAELFAQPNIDGGLIGGAALKAEDFLAIARATK